MKYTQADFTPAFCAEIIAQYGGVDQAARAIVDRCVGFRGGSVMWSTVRAWLTHVNSDRRPAKHPVLENAYSVDDLNRLKNLLDKANVPVEAIKRIEKVKLSSHGVPMKLKDADGKEQEHIAVAHSTQLWLTPEWEDGPAWPVVQPAPPVEVTINAPTVYIPKGLRYEIVTPDKQIGYTRDLDSRHFENGKETYDLLTIHDEAALDVAEQLVAHIQPDGYTDVGDVLDFSEFSRYLQVEEFWRTTQSSIDRAGRHFATIAAAMGSGRKRNGKTVQRKKRIVQGNHDGKRIATYIQQNARAAFGLRPANTTPQHWPDLTFEHLLRTDEYGFEVMGMWPGSEAWLIEGENGLVVVHDPRRRGDYAASVIAGHTHHHREETTSTRTPYGGYREYSRYEIGCLCSLETIKSRTAIQRTRVPSDRGIVKGWTQGIALVEILEETGQHQLQFIRIRDGVAQFQGKVFRAASLATT